MSPQARMAAGNASVPDAGVAAGVDEDAGVGPFVINLTSSTTPMALAHPDAPELKRFTFFVSRRREDNRERFRLHMGYFTTQGEAEEWLNVIRDLYPGAWVGEAPGKKLRARAAAAELAKQLPPPPTARTASAQKQPAVSGAGNDSVAAGSSRSSGGAASSPSTVFSSPPGAISAPTQIAASAAPMQSAAPSKPAAPSYASSPVVAAPGVTAAPPVVVPTLQAAPAIAPSSSPAMAAAAPMLEAVAHAAAALAAVAKTAVAQSAASAPISFEAPAVSFEAPVPASSPRVSAPSSKASSNTGSFRALAPTPGTSNTGTFRAVPSAAAPVAPTQPAVTTFVAAPPASAPVAAATAAPSSPATRAASTPVAGGRAPASPSAQPPAAAKAAVPAKPAKKAPPNVMTDGSNVREVMAALDETGETRQMPIPPGLRAPAAPAAAVAAAAAKAAAAFSPAPSSAGSAPAARSAAAKTGASAKAPAAAAKPAARAPVEKASAPRAQSGADSMSDTQVLRMLETRRSTDGDSPGSDESSSGSISLLKPDDTQTRRALKEAVIDNAPVSFAVQLQWSVQPVNLASVPPLAIFSAYTLYTVEGSREGRKWYGLRLGFFSDAISAKQVAYYVRSEFASVAVVPVSPAEKARASDDQTKASTGAFQRKPVEQKIEEFKLFDDEPAPAPAPKAPEPAAAKPAARSGPARKNKPLGKVRAKEQRSPKTLEETLEILGASDLEIDNGRGELLNDTGVRHLRVEIQKNTPFAKLLDRLSERVRSK